MVEGAAITFRHTGYYIIVIILISRLITARPTVEVLREAVARSNERCRTDAAAVAWHAELIVRFLCARLGGVVAGVRVSEDGFIVLTARLSEDHPTQLSIAVGSKGTCACTISAGDTRLASTAADARSFEQVLKDLLTAVRVRGPDRAGESDG